MLRASSALQNDEYDAQGGAGSWRVWGLGCTVAVLCTVLGMPLLFGKAFAGVGAAVFVGAFLGAAALTCAGGPWLAERCPKVLPWLAGAQVVAAAALAIVVVWAGPECVGAWGALVVGGALGVGHGSSLLLWARGANRWRTRRVLRLVCASFAAAAIVALPVAVLNMPAGVGWGYMAIVACIASGLAVHEGRCAEGTGPSVSDSCACDEVRRWSAMGLVQVWEPVVGLALSLISLALPWGSFLDGEQSSVPPLGTVVVGWLAVASVAIVCRAPKDGRASLELIGNVAIPVLAALVVVLWMVGDVSTLPGWGVVLKGFGSGVACGSFFVLAWTALTCGSPKEAQAWKTTGAGLACAFALAAAILAVHALGGQGVAGAVSPVASLGFLVVVCVVSAVRLARMGSAAGADDGVGEGASSREEAVCALARSGGLSPRETEVLGYLAGGRTAEGIAEVMGISPHTVRAHVRRIHEKLQVSSRDQIAQLVEERRRG